MTVIDILYYIGLILSLVAIVMSFVLLLRVINADKPRQQDDHDYSDLTKILGGTCNWDEEQNHD